MRTCLLRARLITLAVFISCAFGFGCNRHATDTSHAPDESFDVARAMKMFYGNYDATRSASTITFSKADSVFTYDEPMTVRPLFQSFYSDADGQNFVLLTYAVPARDEEYGCHACSPTLGMAVYAQRGSVWTLKAWKQAVTDAGGFGKPPTPIELVQVGPNRYAIKVEDTGGGQGETTTVVQLLVPWKLSVNVALERIVSDDDHGGCEDSGGLPCYANHRTLSFLPTPGADYYDVELVLDGTDLPVSDHPRVWKARKVSGKELLRFRDGKYVQVSRSGDLTGTDRAVADREELK